MDTKTTVEQLKKARAAIDKAIASLESFVEPEAEVAKCIWRGESLAGKKVVRGLCPACYSLLKKRVDSGESTWESLEKEGRALPEAKSGRKPIDIGAIKADARAIESEASASKKTKPKKGDKT